MERPFRDRLDAGWALAEQLARSGIDRTAIVLALPRGGVPVGAVIASRLGLPLDVFLVRKLGVPGQDELAMGAVATGGVLVLNRDVVDALGLSAQDVRDVARQERAELERRERAYRAGRPPPEVAGRPVLLVDDGLATGATMTAAVRALRPLGPASITVAVPLAPEEVCARLEAEADRVVCLRRERFFLSVGGGYEEFRQVSDDEVRDLLARAGAQGAPAPADR